MTILGRYGGWLLLLWGVALAVFGLVESRDVVVLAGALLVASGTVLDRVRVAPRRPSAAREMKAQLRREIEQRIADQARRARNN